MSSKRSSSAKSPKHKAKSVPHAGMPGAGAGQIEDPGSRGQGVRPLSTGFTGNPEARIEPMGSFGQGERGLAGYADSGRSEVFTMPPDIRNPSPQKEASMAEYERSRRVQASEDDVFAFVSDVGNLSTFVPTVEHVEPQPKGRVHVSGEIDHRKFDDDGWFHVDADRRRVEWGSEVRNYSGWLTVAGEDGGAQVVAHLSLPPYVTPSGAPIRGEYAEGRDPIEASLEAALDSLRNLMEGRGGKEAPAMNR